MTDTPNAPSGADLAARTALFAPMRTVAETITLPGFRAGLAVENKQEQSGGYDPVTIADCDCEAALRALIEEHFPGDGIFGEEHGTVRLDADFVWVIDPIDGTRAYVSGVPLWGMLVGIMHQGSPVAGQAFQPYIGESFSGVAGGRAQCLHKGKARTITTRACPALSAATLMTTTPALFSPTERTLYDAIEQSVRAKRYGTDWYAYALVAAGTNDIVIEAGLSPYDILPLVPIIEAAGGSVTDWKGNRLTGFGQSFTGQALALGDATLLDQLLEQLAPAAL